jgi:thioredoxin reductase (NADPH)
VNAPLDCLVVGGGAAGLTAAVYLARYRRRLLVVDAGDSRLAWIPKTRNVMGFPDGIRGTELWERLRQHAREYDVPMETARVDRLQRQADGLFIAEVNGRQVTARTVLLATGARDVTPDMPGLDAGLAAGNVRYCPICDGFETRQQRVAVLGRELHGLRESLFVAGFDNQVTWLTLGTQAAVPDADLARLREHDVRVADHAPRSIRCDPGEGIVVELLDGRVLEFDVMYPALGLVHACELATALGAQVHADGQLEVDDHLRTTVPGLWAAGDVAAGLNQIVVAAGHAAIAATTIHNSL